MPVKPLLDLATAACVKHIKNLESVGDFLPYESTRPILSKVDSAYQLRQIELNSPQIQGRTAELWIRIIEKDFPLEYKAKAYKPQTPDKWYRVWEKYKKEHDAALHESENKLKRALAGLQEDKEKKTSKIVEQKYLPRTKKLGLRRGLNSASNSSASSTLAFNAGTRTKMINGASVMRRVRREVMEIATIHGALSRPIRAPTRHARVDKAPPAMLGDYRRAAQPHFRSSAPSVAPPPPPSVVEQYESRASFISDQDDDDDEEDAPQPLAKQPAPSTSLAAPPSKPSTASKAAKISLLKQRPVALRAAIPTRSVIKTPSRPRPAAGAPPGPGKPLVSKGTATLASKFKRGPPKARPLSTSPTAQPAPVAQASAAAKSRVKTDADADVEADADAAASRQPSASPPLDPAPPGSITETTSPHLSRKRKAVDIFMRPKRRVI